MCFQVLALNYQPAYLAEVQLPVDLVEHVLLDDLVHDDGDEEVEEDGGGVSQAGGVEGHVDGPAGGHLDREGHVVVQRDEQGGQGRRHLSVKSRWKIHSR